MYIRSVFSFQGLHVCAGMWQQAVFSSLTVRGFTVISSMLLLVADLLLLVPAWLLCVLGRMEEQQ